MRCWMRARSVRDLHSRSCYLCGPRIAARILQAGGLADINSRLPSVPEKAGRARLGGYCSRWPPRLHCRTLSPRCCQYCRSPCGLFMEGNPPPMQQRLTILGSTGSIGVSALDVVARHPERFSVFALCAHRNLKRLAEQCLQFAPEYAVIGSAADAAQLKTRLARAGLRTQALCGEAALAALAADSGCDTVIAAIVGAAGLAPTLAAARAGKRLLLANKEALVMSGALLMDAVRRHHAILLPIDSEHNAIYQCLAT